jgi:hypothetical protein
MRELSRWLTFVVATLVVTVTGLGGNNLFGIFRTRRLKLHHVQELRESHAERNGFAGPHGKALTGDEARELLNRRRRSVWKLASDWFRHFATLENPNRCDHEDDERK